MPVLDPAALTTAAVSIGGAGVVCWKRRTGIGRATTSLRAPHRQVALRSMLPTHQTDALAFHLRIGGPRESPILACSSSAAAIATVTDLIETGVVDVGLAGGVDTLTRLCFMGFNALKLLDPQPCRPFARDRRGMSLGEGAAVLVLESWQHAVARGVPLRAWCGRVWACRRMRGIRPPRQPMRKAPYVPCVRRSHGLI